MAHFALCNWDCERALMKTGARQVLEYGQWCVVKRQRTAGALGGLLVRPHAAREFACVNVRRGRAKHKRPFSVAGGVEDTGRIRA